MPVAVLSEPVADVVRESTREVVKKSRLPRIRESLQVDLDFSHAFASPQYVPTTARPHILFAPLHYEAGYAYPLLIWLHSAGEDERQVMRVMPSISMRNYVAIAPQGISQNIPQESDKKTCDAQIYAWDFSEAGVSWAERAVFESVDLAQKRCNIAPQKIYLLGSGAGGTMALQLAMRFPTSFAGVVSLGGGLPANERPLQRWNQIRKLPVLLLASEESTQFPRAEAARLEQLLHVAGVPVTLNYYPTQDEIAPIMLQEINRWIMNRVCH